MNQITAADIIKHIYANCDWVNPETTVDRVIAGDAEKPIHTALVTWISSRQACREAVARGADLLVTHEPTFWNHRDDRSSENDPHSLEKQREIDESGLVILRLHDSWDLFPGIGIPFAWAQFLGISDPPAQISSHRYQHRYDIAPLTAGEFAHRVAARTAAISEPAVEFTGDPEQTIRSVGIGTGCGCDPRVFQEMGCELAVVCDDGIAYWAHLQRCADIGMPAVCVNHGTSEEPGMMSLAAYLRETFPAISVEHLPHPCCFTRVTA